MRWLISLIFFVSVSAQAAENSVAAEVEAEKAAIENTELVTAEVQESPAAPSKNDNKKESEILLNLDGAKKANAEGSGMFRVLFTISILGLVGTGAFFFLRKYRVPRAAKHQTQIKVLQQHYLGPKKSLAIIRVAGESILIGVTDHNISMIKNLSLLDDEIPEEAPHHFGNVLGNMDEGEEKKTSRASRQELDSDEEFAISGIKDIVSKRLKGMRSFQ